MSAGLARTFASLSVPNYRRYFSGLVVSITGNWMQNVAEMWLVVQLTGNGVSVGLTAALQFVPIMLFGSDYWRGLLDWLSDPVLREGKIAPEDIERLQVVDEPSEVLAILEDVEHRRPRRAA